MLVERCFCSSGEILIRQVNEMGVGAERLVHLQIKHGGRRVGGVH